MLKLLDVWLSRNSIDEKRAALKDIFDAEMPPRLLVKEVKMCNYSDAILRMGENKGLEKGRAEGRLEGILESMKNLVKKGRITIEEAAEESNMSVSDFEEKTGLKAEK